MSSINLGIDYHKHLRNAKPIVLKKTTKKSAKGALGAISTFPEQIIPPLNTIIQFDIFPQYKLSEHSGLASLDHRVLPINFNWRSDGGVKSKLLTK